MLIVLLALLPLIPGILMVQMMVQNSLRDRSMLEEGLSLIYREQLGLTAERFSLTRNEADPDALLNHLTRVFGEAALVAIGRSDQILLSEHVGEDSENAVVHTIQEGAYQGWSVSLKVSGNVLVHSDEQRREIWWHAFWVLSGVLVVAGAAWLTVHRRLRIDEIRSDLLTTISHEIKTPVAAMKVLMESLEDGSLPAESRPEYYELLHRENDRIGELADHFLLHSRLEKGQLPVRFEPVDLSTLVAGEVKLIRPQLDSVSGELAFEGGPSTIVQTDPVALKIVLSNLLENAVKYGGQPPLLTVKIVRSDRYAEISISDQGDGIPRSERRAVFRRFYRGDVRLTGGRGGVGLGLPICRLLVRLLKGDIRVSSGPDGIGALFLVRIPIVS
ncbi:HAMP domain-containing sensor histidine kinase [Verrucomicrobiales bacterium BCK34]|nr:HAMP domain-containing sensor histidine kinase [Verrucomicrobiales bacterium BCK34]